MNNYEIIKQLEKDPALRSQMRAVLLTTELLELPSVVVELTRQVTTIANVLEDHERRLGTLESSLNILIDHQSEMQNTVTNTHNSLFDLAQMTADGFRTMQQGFTEMGKNLGTAIGTLDTKIDELDGKFTAKFDQLDARIDGLDELDGKFTAKFDQLDARIDELDGKFTAKFDQLDADIRVVKRILGN